jgi:catalase
MATKQTLPDKKPRSPKAKAPGKPARPASPQDQLAIDTERTASAMPHNANKLAEYGADAAVPPEGLRVGVESRAVTGSTLSEGNASAKTGGAAVRGSNPACESLERVRVDATDAGLTTNQGVSVADNQSSLKAGLRGPALLKDFVLREKITHFDHERIPERIVHARGSGAHGYFECYASNAALTRAAPFQETGKQTPVFVRFSTVAGERLEGHRP